MGRELLRNSTILFLLALLVRACYAIFFVEPEHLLIEDQMQYLYLAQEFPESGFLGISTERMPGYPLFLAIIHSIFGEGMLLGIVVVQILLDSVSCVVIALMAHFMFGKGFWIAGTISAINLNMIILSASVLTDTLFLFLFILFLFSLMKYLKNEQIIWLFLFVLFISLATLVRPLTYYLLPILLIWIVGWRLWHRDSILKIGMLTTLYLAVVVAILGGIVQHNYNQYGATNLTSDTGRHVLGWIVPATYQYSGKGSYQEGLILAKEKLDLALRRDNLVELPLNPFEKSSYKANVGKEILLDFGYGSILKAWISGSIINLLSPSVAFAPALRSLEHPSFYETEGDGVVSKLLNYIKNSNGFLYLSILAVGTIISILFIFLSLIGVLKMFSTYSVITTSTLILLVGYFLAITGPVLGLKYRLPIEPILIIFVTYAILNRSAGKDLS